MIKVILPKTLVDLKPYPEHPLFYLGGPIFGADDWQYPACRMLEGLAPDSFVAVPRRYGAKSVLWGVQAKGSPDHFPRQLLWERHYMWLAGGNIRLGCLVFWLCSESPHNRRNDGNPYAMDTRGELGEWRATLKYSRGAKVVIGAEPDFPGLEVIQTNFNEALGYEFPFYDSLEETLREAAKLGRAGWSEAA